MNNANVKHIFKIIFRFLFMEIVRNIFIIYLIYNNLIIADIIY